MDSLSANAKTPEADLSGRELGGYRLLRRLGRGAMAEVYLAEQTSLRRQVAVKVLRSDLANDATYVRRFHMEAQAAASLVHANIVQIYEVGCADGIHFISQEYIQGLNLRELLARRGPPDLKQALAIMRQTTSALRKAAEQGIVHRDIKPENIMVASSGEVKVADFGLARVIGGDATPDLTQAGFTMGTPLYMSPEQVEGKRLDPRSDIYSFGVTCYHMLAGEAPFRGETALSVALQHLKQQPERLENLRPDLPPALCRVIHKMLAKEPGDRYSSPQELARDLRAITIDGEPADDGEDELKALASEETNLAFSDRLAATERLTAIMRTSAMPTVGRWQWRWAVAAIAVAFSLGAAIAWARRPAPLLAASASDSDELEARESAEAQFIYALMVDSEEGWLSVERNFPNNKVFIQRARQQLARWYLDEDEDASAMKLFSEFADMPEEEVSLRAFGVAGQALVLAKQGKTKEAADKLVLLTRAPLQGHLDAQMEERVAVLLRKQGGRLGVSSDSWRRPGNRHPPGAGPANPGPPSSSPSNPGPQNPGPPIAAPPTVTPPPTTNP